MITKDASYHESAIKYNEGIAVFAKNLAEEIEHPEVKRWALVVFKQHKFHLGRHRKALEKLKNLVPKPQPPKNGINASSVITDEQQEYAKQMAEREAAAELVQKDAGAGPQTIEADVETTEEN